MVHPNHGICEVRRKREKNLYWSGKSIRISWSGNNTLQFSSVTQSSLTLRPHESQHARPPCPSPTQTHVHQVSDAIQPSHPLSSPSPPAPNPSQHQSLPMSQLFAWSGQSTGVSALASFLPKKSQGWSPSEWTGWIPLQSKGLSRLFSNTTALTFGKVFCFLFLGSCETIQGLPTWH